MPRTAATPAPPFALPLGRCTAPESGWKKRAGAGQTAGPGTQKNIFAFAIQRGCVSSPQLFLPEKSLERSSWKISAYKQDIEKSGVLRRRKKYAPNKVPSPQEKTNIFILLYAFSLGTCRALGHGAAGSVFTGLRTAPSAAAPKPELLLGRGVWRLGPAHGASLKGNASWWSQTPSQNQLVPGWEAHSASRCWLPQLRVRTGKDILSFTNKGTFPQLKCWDRFVSLPGYF